MSSKISMKNNLGNTLTISHSDDVENISIDSVDLSKVITINSLSELRDKIGYGKHKPPTIWISGYHTKGDNAFGNCIFEWDENCTDSHNGGTIIDPDAIFPIDWSDYTQVNSWYNYGSVTSGRYKLRYSDAVNVKWFGAKTDGTDNTAVYTKIINSVPEGTLIEWTPESYTGNFISHKAFELKGNGATLLPVEQDSTQFIIQFIGTIGNYNNLNIAPKYNDTVLNSIAGIDKDSYILLYSGNKRPYDEESVNYEVVKARPDGTVYDKVYSNQNGGNPQYAVINTLDGVKIDNFIIDAGNYNTYGVFIKYASNIEVSNIRMIKGAYTTISIRYTYNVKVRNIQRIKATKTGSGGVGYNVQLWGVKYGQIDSIYGEENRHDYDQDSTYGVNISNVKSIDAKSSAIELAHNSYTGYITLRDCIISKCNSYGVNISSQGLENISSGLIRELLIDNIRITNTKKMNEYDFYVGVYVGIPSENIEISNITVDNISNTVFDYPNDSYNTGYYIVRLYDPRKNTKIYNISAIAATNVISINNISNENANVTIDTINIERYASAIFIHKTNNYCGDVTILNVNAYEDSSVYGKALVELYDDANRLRQLNIYGFKYILHKGKMISIKNNNIYCSEGKIEPIGFIRDTSTLNSLQNEDTITQYDYLTRGDFAIWGGGSDITLNTTEPIERPILTGIRFAIFNYGNHTITIPGGSETVDNSSDLVLEGGYLYEFEPFYNKWHLARKISGITLS